MRTIIWTVALSAWLTGCNDNKSTPVPSSSAPGPSAASQPLASAAPSAAPAPAASAATAPTCKLESPKVWATGVNPTTGLTEATLPDGRVAVGLAVGLTPKVLVVRTGGEGKLYNVGLKLGTRVASPPPPDEGVRHLLRVTPARIAADHASAYIDLRDEMKNHKRFVRCGPADSDDAWVLYDEVPLLDKLTKHFADELGLLGLDKKPLEKHEIRDCRTFQDQGTGEAWVLGTKFVAKKGVDDKYAYKAILFVDTGPTSPERHLHEVPLAGDPPKPFHYETPVSARMMDGRIATAVRLGGALMVGFLTKDKGLAGGWKTYTGGYAMPDLGRDGDDLMLTTSVSQKGPGEHRLRGLRIAKGAKELPTATTPIDTDGDGTGAESSPSLKRDSQGRLWLAHIEGTRGKGKLSIAELTSEWKPVGKAISATQEGETAAMAKLVPTSDGKLVLVWLRNTPKGLELVSEDFVCGAKS